MASKRKSPPLKVAGEDFLFPTKRKSVEEFEFSHCEEIKKHQLGLENLIQDKEHINFESNELR